MKKFFTILLSLVFSIGANAQQVPNGGFENWTNPNYPDYWGTFGNLAGPGAMGLTAPYFATKDVSAGNHVEGLASIKLTTDTLPAFAGGLLLSSIACMGVLSLDDSSRFQYSGIAYTKRPTTLYFSYKYAPATPSDTGIMEFYLSKNDTSIFGGYGYAIVKKLSTTGGSFVNASISLTPYYTSAAQPDTLQMLFFSSTSSSASTFGSTLWIDGVHFDASVNVGIEGINGEVKGINAYPNPTNGELHIAIEANEVGSQLQLFDMEGREVYNGVLNGTSTSIDTRSLEAGMYAIRVNSIDKITTYKGTIAVTK